MQINVGSFRDPSGQVFARNGRIYRSVFEHGVNEFVAARDAGVYDKLIADGFSAISSYTSFHQEINL
jgi:hypothetical protein